MPLSKKRSYRCAALMAATAVSLVSTEICFAQQFSPLTPLPAYSIMESPRDSDATKAEVAPPVDAPSQSFWADKRAKAPTPAAAIAAPKSPKAAKRFGRFISPLKPMVSPDAPVVKLARRSGFHAVTTETAITETTAAESTIRENTNSSVETAPVDFGGSIDLDKPQLLTGSPVVQEAQPLPLASVSMSKPSDEPVAEIDNTSASNEQPQLAMPAPPADVEIESVEKSAQSVVSKIASNVENAPATEPASESKNASVATAKNAVVVSNDFPLAAATPSVVVRSPFVQPGNPNRYLFVIENIGSVDAFGTRVDLRVPAGVVLKQVVADSASSTARHAVIRFNELKAGSKAIVEVEVNPTSEIVVFDTSMTLETKRSFRGATLPRTRIASNIPAATESPDSSNGAAKRAAKLTSFESAAPAAATTAGISANLDGPVMLASGETGDFSIRIKNPNNQSASDIVVQLKIPAGLKIAVLDREAWVNEEDQTISWELSGIEAGQTEVIRYQAIGQTDGQQLQKVSLGMDNVYQGDAKLVTLVSP